MREAELLITCATLLGCVLIAVWRARPRVQWWGLVLGLGAMPLVVGMWLSRQHDRRRAQALAVHEPRDRSARLGSAWASAKRCQACHAGAHATWQATYHRRMTQRATADAVLARWEGEVVDQGRRYRFIQRDGRYYVDMPRYGTNGESAERRMLRPVVLTTGSHHQQLYWISLPWADDRPYEEADVLYQTRCASCHGAEGWQGEAKQLRKAGLFASAVDTVLRSEGHQALLPSGPLDDADRTKLVDFVLRLQSEDRLMQFPLAWLVEEQRWVNEEHTFLHPEPEPDRVETFQERWSNNCDQCHAVGATFDEPTLGRLGRSEVADLGIACEACHGQGAVHADRHESPLARYETHVAGAAEDDIVNPRDLPPAESAAVCGQCHAETWPLDAPTPAFRPGERLEDHERVVQFVEGPRPKWLTDAVAIDSELLDSGFWRDGTMRIAGRDYNGLTISPCHETGGLTCIDCHQLHGSDPNDQLAAAARDGRTLCGRCHEAIAADVAAHSHHPAGSTGSDCYNCHMPRTTYGLLTVIRAHRIDSPSVWQSQRGRPNACNLCHLDKTLAEVGEHLTAWYGQPTPVGLDLEAPAAAVQWLIAGDAVQRAVVAEHFGWPPAQAASGSWWMAPLLAQLLDDRYAAVRHLAAKSLATLPRSSPIDYDYVGPPAARIEAAQREVARWQRDPALRGRSLPAAFIEGGDLLVGPLLALESRRDDADVTVNE